MDGRTIDASLQSDACVSIERRHFNVRGSNSNDCILLRQFRHDAKPSVYRSTCELLYVRERIIYLFILFVFFFFTSVDVYQHSLMVSKKIVDACKNIEAGEIDGIIKVYDSPEP